MPLESPERFLQPLTPLEFFLPKWCSKEPQERLMFRARPLRSDAPTPPNHRAPNKRGRRHGPPLTYTPKPEGGHGPWLGGNRGSSKSR